MEFPPHFPTLCSPSVGTQRTESTLEHPPQVLQRRTEEGGRTGGRRGGGGGRAAVACLRNSRSWTELELSHSDSHSDTLKPGWLLPPCVLLFRFSADETQTAPQPPAPSLRPSLPPLLLLPLLLFLPLLLRLQRPMGRTQGVEISGSLFPAAFRTEN